MAGYKSIKDQIVVILNTLVPTYLTIVYPKEAKVLSDGGYPAATVEAKEHSSNFYSLGTSGMNERVYQHYVRLYFRTDEKNDSDYEDVLETTADAVITAFEQNITLNGSCEYAIPISGEWKYGEKDSYLRVFEMVISSTAHVAR